MSKFGHLLGRICNCETPACRATVGRLPGRCRQPSDRQCGQNPPLLLLPCTEVIKCIVYYYRARPLWHCVGSTKLSVWTAPELLESMATVEAWPCRQGRNHRSLRVRPEKKYLLLESYVDVVIPFFYLTKSLQYFMY